MKNKKNLLKKLNYFLSMMALALGAMETTAMNTPDPYLVQAFEGVWKMERIASTLVTDQVNTHVKNGILRHQPQIKDAPVYMRESYETAHIEYRKKRYPASQSPWGNFPHLDPDTLRLFELNIPQTRYLVLSGGGENLFSATDWRRYRFLHVFDMGRSRQITNYYPLFSEANLGERVLGRLPNSPVLNYARLVPAKWDNHKIIGYEVLLYDLDRKGITRSTENSLPISYFLHKSGTAPEWQLTSISATPVADELDRKGHYFTGAREAYSEYDARQASLAEAQARPATSKKSPHKKTKTNNRDSKPKTTLQR